MQDCNDKLAEFILLKMKEKNITGSELARRMKINPCNISTFTKRHTHNATGKPLGVTLGKALDYLSGIESNLTEFERFYRGL